VAEQAQNEASQAASLLGRLSAEARRRKWGEEGFVVRMREYGKLGGRPPKAAGKTKRVRRKKGGRGR